MSEGAGRARNWWQVDNPSFKRMLHIQIHLLLIRLYWLILPIIQLKYKFNWQCLWQQPIDKWFTTNFDDFFPSLSYCQFAWKNPLIFFLIPDGIYWIYSMEFSLIWNAIPLWILSSMNFTRVATNFFINRT